MFEIRRKMKHWRHHFIQKQRFQMMYTPMSAFSFSKYSNSNLSLKMKIKNNNRDPIYILYCWFYWIVFISELIHLRIMLIICLFLFMEKLLFFIFFLGLEILKIKIFCWKFPVFWLNPSLKLLRKNWEKILFETEHWEMR